MSTWQGFISGSWQETIDVRDFIQRNYRPYEQDEQFLAGPTERTRTLFDKYERLRLQELDSGGEIGRAHV